MTRSLYRQEHQGRNRRRRPWVLLFAVGICLAVLVAAFEFVWRLEADIVVGSPRIIDGDSLAFGDLNVRLAGIDAPERAQTCLDKGGDNFACGRAATDYLRFLIDDRGVTCSGRGRDRYGRMIAECRANGVDLSREMVRRGWAVAYMGDLDTVEADAKRLEVGLWAGSFIPPQQWRRDRRSADSFATLGVVREAIARAAAVARGERVLRAPADG